MAKDTGSRPTFTVSDHKLLKYIRNGMEGQPCSANSMWAHAA